MRYYILFLPSISILLPQNPPTMPSKRGSYVKKISPPLLPAKQYNYVMPNEHEVIRPQSIVHYEVKLYHSKIGSIFYECNGVTFPNQLQAEKYCLMLNNYELKKAKQNQQHRTSINKNHRNSLLRSNSDLSNKKKPILRVSGSLTERKHSSSGSRNSLLGLSRSSSSQSLAESSKHLTLVRNDVSGSNNGLSSRRGSAFGSNNDLSSGGDSGFGSTKDLSSRRNSISGSTNDLSGKRRSSSLERRNSLSSSREILKNKVIDNEIYEESFDKNIKKKSKSYQIWLKVWKNCNFKCISENYYDGYRQHALLEMNMYRLHHGVNILEFSSKLTEIAQELVEQYLITQALDTKLYPNYGILYGKSTIMSASTIIKHFYETNAKYSFYFNKPNSEAAYSFAQIVWKSTTQLGIGVQHDSGYLFVVCVFYPKGNKKKEYGKNVYRWKG
uniref:SCP domain-containing protein n=1 Tax=Strongyloides papillosus TaxID=174720 RepID=A0A0N5BD30_STREA